MNLFKNKIEKNLENRLKNNKSSLEDKMDALTSYLIYLRKNNQKKENEIFLEIIKNFKGSDKKQLFSEQSLIVNKETLFLVDKKNRRCLLNNKFCKVLSSFSSTQMTIFATTLEQKQPYLDIFVNGNLKSSVLRIDFKNVLNNKSIDFELYLKDLQREKDEIIDSNIKDLLIEKKLFVINKNINLPMEVGYITKQLNSKTFFNAMKYMSEKLYPILFEYEGNICLQYVSVRELDRFIQNEESRFLPFNEYLENCKDLKILLENDIIILPESLLKRNSNFYIV